MVDMALGKHVLHLLEADGIILHHNWCDCGRNAVQGQCLNFVRAATDTLQVTKTTTLSDLSCCQ